MLKLKTTLLDVDRAAAEAEHYYGSSYGDVAVIETAATGRELVNGAVQGASVYGFVWTGKTLRRANELESYAFRNV